MANLEVIERVFLHRYPQPVIESVGKLADEKGRLELAFKAGQASVAAEIRAVINDKARRS